MYGYGAGCADFERVPHRLPSGPGFTHKVNLEIGSPAMDSSGQRLNRDIEKPYACHFRI